MIAAIYSSNQLSYTYTVLLNRLSSNYIDSKHVTSVCHTRIRENEEDRHVDNICTTSIYTLLSSFNLL